MNSKLILCSILHLLILPFVALAAEKEAKFSYEDSDLKFRLIPQSQEQIAAFYEGRGFKKPTIEIIRKACFMTVLMTNKSSTKIWLDLENWRFLHGIQPIARLRRAYWEKQWKMIEMPLAHQSTFGWTQLPESRDLHPNEPVGGNISFAKRQSPMVIEARFKTGEQKTGKEIVLRFENVRCK